MKHHESLWKNLLGLAMAAALLNSAPPCHGRTSRITAEDECEQTVLYRPAVGPDKGGIITQARGSHPNWANADSPDHAGAIDAVITGFFDSKNQRGCQAIMLASVNTAKLISLEYQNVFDQFRNKIQNLQQSGGNASSGGTTNLVSKSFGSQLLSFASEYGGITQSTSGQTTTFSGSLSGIPLAIESSTGAPIFAECSASTSNSKCFSPGAMDALSRFSFSAGVNSSGGTVGSGTATGGQGTTQPVILTGASSSSNFSLNQVTSKIAIFRQLPTVSTLNAAAGKLDKTVLANMSQQATGLTAYLTAIDSSKDALKPAAEALLNGDASAPNSAWQSAAERFAAAVGDVDPNYMKSIAPYLKAATEFSAQEDIAYTSGIKPTLSLEYDFNNPANQPTNSVFKLIGAWVPGNWTLTLNGAASIYNSQPSSSIPSATWLRDVQLAAEADYKLKKSLPLVGSPTFSWAFYYQDQTSPSILKVPISGLPITGLSPTTNQVFMTRGPIDIGQFKISLGKSSSGVSVPLSMTVSNRTELLTGMDVRGQIGISYDFSSLLSK
jgi:hypothetical protein